MERFIRFLSSYKGSIILLVIYSIWLATATILENKMGANAAKMLIYYSPLFISFQSLLVINFILILLKSNFFKKGKYALIVIHISLIVILGGALTTFLLGKEGQVHIREGEKTNQMIMHTSKGIIKETLPFELELIDFRLNRYPGSQSPSSYESDLLVHVDDTIIETTVYMNNVLDMKGYRFFQASFDQDELGTVLSVNIDVAGRVITYTGYTLLLAGFLLMFFMPNSRFRKLVRKLKEIRIKENIILLVFLLSLVPFYSLGQQNNTISNIKQHKIPVEHANKFGALPVQFRGRIIPMNTFSSEILRKLHKETRIYNMNSDQFLLSLYAMPQKWMLTPFIATDEGFVSYHQFFDEQGNYRLLPQLKKIYQLPQNEWTKSDKDLIKLDERINIFYSLITHSMPGIFPDPDDTTNTWLTSETYGTSNIVNEYIEEVKLAVTSNDWDIADETLNDITNFQLEKDESSLINSNKIEAELRYNQLNIFHFSKVGYLIIGGILLIFSFTSQGRNREWIKYLILLLKIGVVSIFIYHLFGMLLRWYISGYAPWSNSYETMIYVSWVTVLAGLVFGRKSAITLSLATLFGGIILFVSGLNWMDPQINTLVPVLKSHWLMFHVAVIVGAYGFFGVSFLIGITNISMMAFAKNNKMVQNRINELSVINNLSLLIGLVLMTVGTFLGAVWANESWGRYWGWDPKETWALITIIVYSIVTHLHLVKKWNSLWLFNLLSVIAFSSVLMTFLGVNYFFSGMHSYGQVDSMSSVFLYIAIGIIVIILLGIITYKKRVVFKEF